MTTLKCTDCGDDIMFGNDIVYTWQQWQCPVCSQWVDWKKGEFDSLRGPMRGDDPPHEPTQPGKWAVSVVARTTYIVQANSMAEANDIARNLASGESVTVEASEPYSNE